MTVHKKWDIERSRDRFSPPYIEHEKWKWGDYGGHTGYRICQGRW